MLDQNNHRFQGPMKHTALNARTTRLIGTKRLDGAPRPPEMSFNIVAKGIAFTVFTNVKDDEDYGKIGAVLNFQDAMMLPILLEQSVRMAPGTFQTLSIAVDKYDANTRQWSSKPAMQIKIGRDDQGVIYLDVASWKRTRPVPHFELLPSNSIRLTRENGDMIPNDKLSELGALRLARVLSTLIPISYVMDFVPPKERPAQGNGGNYGGNDGGSGNHSYNNNRSYGNQGGQNSSNHSNYGNQNDYGDLPM